MQDLVGVCCSLGALLGAATSGLSSDVGLNMTVLASSSLSAIVLDYGESDTSSDPLFSIRNELTYSIRVVFEVLSFMLLRWKTVAYAPLLME